MDADTGNNDANQNGGDVDGDPSIVTGNAMTDIGVYNDVNSNSVGDPFQWPWNDIDPLDYDLSFDLEALLAYFSLHLG